MGEAAESPGTCPYCEGALSCDARGPFCAANAKHPFTYRPGTYPKSCQPWGKRGTKKGGGGRSVRHKAPHVQKYENWLRKTAAQRAAAMGET